MGGFSAVCIFGVFGSSIESSTNAVVDDVWADEDISDDENVSVVKETTIEENVIEETAIEDPVIEETTETVMEETVAEDIGEFSFAEVPVYNGTAYAVINENVPYFYASDLETAKTAYESYSDLDSLGRCGVCVASIGIDIMPTEERGEIGSVKPSGWHTVKYNGIIDGNYLYNRCHLIGYQLTGENANTQNLIRYGR